ncbi:protein GLUTAMINE DUMPER 4-like [Miscanthus floridulus]|uniref:protein GLUTAMINE DUMPER 4-like n=1 Tax=Miscanthus floridulus TaxID=154761 RepID=UPI003458459E
MWPAGAEHPMGMGHGPAAPSPRPSTTATTHSASAWQSPVPYLFGGLAAMLGLIALSLLALACSYWKLSGSFLASAGEPDDDLERRAGAGAGGRPGDGKAAAAAWERWREHVVVIMAGDERPTFLATPASGRGAPDDARRVVVSVGCGGGGGSGSEDGEEGRCVECGARSWPARAADDDGALSQQSGVTVSGSSVIGER